MADRPMTRAAAMAMADERRLIRQGYDFLDEKRMLLATETMKQLARWERLWAEDMAAMAEARAVLARALMQHGLEELQVHPRRKIEGDLLRSHETRFLGVTLVDTQARVEPEPEGRDKAGARDDALRCAAAFRALLPVAAQMAAASGNLLRLAAEYRRTERRARALENVLLPEISQALKAIEEQLEAVDLEDAVRVRLSRR